MTKVTITIADDSWPEPLEASVLLQPGIHAQAVRALVDDALRDATGKGVALPDGYEPLPEVEECRGRRPRPRSNGVAWANVNGDPRGSGAGAVVREAVIRFASALVAQNVHHGPIEMAIPHGAFNALVHDLGDLLHGSPYRDPEYGALRLYTPAGVVKVRGGS